MPNVVQTDHLGACGATYGASLRRNVGVDRTVSSDAFGPVPFLQVSPVAHSKSPSKGVGQVISRFRAVFACYSCTALSSFKTAVPGAPQSDRPRTELAVTLQETPDGPIVLTGWRWRLELFGVPEHSAP